jgi:hypothetical protein
VIAYCFFRRSESLFLTTLPLSERLFLVSSLQRAFVSPRAQSTPCTKDQKKRRYRSQQRRPRTTIDARTYLSPLKRDCVHLQVTWRLTDADGTELASGSETVTDVPSQADACITTLDLSAALAKFGARDLLVWLEWQDRRKETQELWRHVADAGESYVSR